MRCAPLLRPMLLLLLAAFAGVERIDAQQTTPERWCLSFHAVHPTLAAEEARRSGMPAGYRIFPNPNDPQRTELVLLEAPIVHGGDVIDASAGPGHLPDLAVVNFRFNDAAARRLATFTTQNVGRPFAIVVDGVVFSAPLVREPILSGQGMISGAFTHESAAALANRLRSGQCMVVGGALAVGDRA